MPRHDGGRLVLAVDVSPWLRPDAGSAAQRAFCWVRGRSRNTGQAIPGWPYSILVAVEPGRSSWVAVLDAVRLVPGDDVTAVTGAQVRATIDRLRDTGQWQPGDPPIMVLCDAGYDLTRLAWLLADLPLVVAGRVRSDRVYRATPPPSTGLRGRPARHGTRLDLTQPATGPRPDQTTATTTRRYGTATATAWHRMHQRLTHRDGWTHHDGPLPVIDGTVIRLHTDRYPKPLWLWTSEPTPDATAVDRCWQAYLRRFDIEHWFRFCKQTLGWTTPRLRDPAAADRWTWLIIAAYTQLRLARHHSTDLRRPWERPITPTSHLTPNRVRRGFRYLRTKLPQPARVPKNTRPGPGRPPGSRNRQPTPHHDPGKPQSSTTKTSKG
nr:transposase [Actinoplanes awajinensis]